MAHEPRIWDPREIYHLTAHGIDDRPIVRDDIDAQELVMRLGRVVRTRRWECFGVCIMQTHEHIVVRAPAGDISDGIQTLNSGFARAFNLRHGRRGTVFEAHFRDRRIRNQAHLLSTIRYLARNPGEQRAATYPWSTYPQLIRLLPRWPWFDPGPVVELFGSVAALRDFVEGREHRQTQKVFDTLKVSKTPWR